MWGLPGLTFVDRSDLFRALCELETRCRANPVSAAVIPVMSGGRDARYIREPMAARTALTSSARKGRPAASLKGLGGYVALSGTDFTSAHADVVAALRRTSRDVLGLHMCLARSRELCVEPDERDDAAYVWLALIAHLVGLVPSPELRRACGPVLSMLRQSLDTPMGQDEAKQRADLVIYLASRTCERSVFVRVLAERGWSAERVATEIVTLSFAGWASLAAAISTGRSLGATGSAATADAVTELLRVCAPGWLVVRECVEDVPLPGADEPVPAGTLLIVSPWLLHRDPRAWRDPARYDPTRPGTRRSHWYLPFSAGGRSCPAEAYARVFVRAALSGLPVNVCAAHVRPTLAEGRSACLIACVDQEDS